MDPIAGIGNVVSHFRTSALPHFRTSVLSYF